MKKIYQFLCAICVVFGFTACADMLETDSNLVEYEKDNTLNHPTDSVYSVLGIINKIQVIADRMVLLGEVRGDLVTTTNVASSDLKRLADFELSQDNKYNQVSDYYAVINNCNYYLAHVDTAMQRRGRQVFKEEYAAVKAFRAWTYLQLVKAYGKVPLVLTPMMTEREARDAMNRQYSDIKEVCNTFIDDLTPYADVDLPDFGTINSTNSQYFFIPMKALLGDLCLWAEKYQDAARWYHEFLNDREAPVMTVAGNSIQWASVSTFDANSISDAYSIWRSSDDYRSNEILSYIPMESEAFHGNVSDLTNLFCSTTNNNYYNQLTPSRGMYNLSAEQVYCIKYQTATSTTPDTVYAPTSGLFNEAFHGDLRFYSNFRETAVSGKDSYSERSSVHQTIYKFRSEGIVIYRSPIVYLHYAEALNRAGYPQSAFAVLKYGLCQDNLKQAVDTAEQRAAGDLIKFSTAVFNYDNTRGIHSRGSGDSECNAHYVMPMPSVAKSSRQDTIDYQIPIVEDMIVDELALEGAFEGNRFYDLLRVASRSGRTASYLADRVACRNGIKDAALHAKLMDKNNWFLPLP